MRPAGADKVKTPDELRPLSLRTYPVTLPLRHHCRGIEVAAMKLTATPLLSEIKHTAAVVSCCVRIRKSHVLVCRAPVPLASLFHRAVLIYGAVERLDDGLERGVFRC